MCPIYPLVCMVGEELHRSLLIGGCDCKEEELGVVVTDADADISHSEEASVALK